jgi:hypothetical protein
MRATPWIVVGGLTFALLTLPLFAQNEPKLAAPAEAKLPITKVTLFNAGIGYFQREGTIDGTTRVDLKVNEEDVNDLILTLLANDPNGKAQAVTYDNKAPAEITLKAFSIDLTENPTLGNLLQQVRGEKVDITDQNGSQLVGNIVSVEKPAAQVYPAAPSETPTKPVVIPAPAGAIDQISLLTDDGLQTIPLARIKKVKFAKAELQAEFRKALEALAAARGASTKSVGVTFAGQGQRKVSVGYIADAPLWKPTYRLVLNENKPTIQGFAAIENTTDEDWENVKVKLVSGRPVTFKMDLYDPLFVPRPVVEPEMYASLRPPMYQGVSSGNLSGAAAFQGFGGFQGGFGGLPGLPGAGQGGLNLGVGGGFLGTTGGQVGMTGGSYPLHAGGITRPSVRSLMGQRLNFESLNERKKGAIPPVKTTADPVALDKLGESFEFNVAEPVSLARFKSALLPVIRETLESKQVSIYNSSILMGFPMKGLYLKNSSKVYLPQGPIAVFESDTAAGQARLPDMNPGESRLLSYAIDLDVRIQEDPADLETKIVSNKLINGVVHSVRRSKITTRYKAFNKSILPKTVWITQVIEQDRKLIAPEKAVEKTDNLYRFELVIPPQKTVDLKVVEELEVTPESELKTLDADQLNEFIKDPATPPAVKAAIEKYKAALLSKAETSASIAEENDGLKEIAEEQKRLRENLAVTPKDSDAYKRYVKKFDDQETEIEKRRAKLKELNKQLAKQAKEIEDLQKTLSAE